VYRQAGLRRLEEADALLHNSRPFPSGAIYLGGYALECQFKWFICRAAEPRPVHYLEDLPDQGLVARLLSARGHDLELLAVASGQWQAIRQDVDLRRHFNQVQNWTVRLRYSAVAGDVGNGTRFLAAARRLRRWLESRAP